MLIPKYTKDTPPLILPPSLTTSTDYSNVMLNPNPKLNTTEATTDLITVITVTTVTLMVDTLTVPLTDTPVLTDTTTTTTDICTKQISFISNKIVPANRNTIKYYENCNR